MPQQRHEPAAKQLKVAAGQHSDRGRKPVNQDSHGLYIPSAYPLASKGIAIALADGISSSGVSQIASEAAVTGFLEDYFCTSDAWSVKKSAHCVLAAINSWLYSQTHQSQYRYDHDRGYVCTFSALILKGTTAHVFHVGDARVYRLRDDHLEKLTDDHRLWVSRDQSYLSRALGVSPRLEVDYATLEIEAGDVFILMTDGTYEYALPDFIRTTIRDHPEQLDTAAALITDHAYARGSDDNLTIQIARVEQLPPLGASATCRRLGELPRPQLPQPRALFEGFRIVRELHGSSRSHVYLATDLESGDSVALKMPSIDLRDDPAYLERFMMEDWIARRLNNPHVLRPHELSRSCNYLYMVTEFVEGQTLDQWMIDNPQPDVERVRQIIEQIAKGLRAFHRLEMLHQDLRPANIMIDSTGTVKIIDFGSTRVAGIAEIAPPADTPLGTAQYSAPEYFLGEPGTPRSDLFSLGVIAYQMLSGKLPYGTQLPKCRTKAALRKLRYRTLSSQDRGVPVWVDGAIRKAVHPDPYKRYPALSEFIHDLRHPNRDFMRDSNPPLLEKNPVAFWQGVAFCQVLVILILLLRS